RTLTGSHTAANPISRYSASLAAPVGAAFAYEIRGCGENPDEYAMGTAARRNARSKARAKSRWLVKRARPRFVYLTRSHCTGGACCSGWVRDGSPPSPRLAPPPCQRLVEVVGVLIAVVGGQLLKCLIRSIQDLGDDGPR